MSFIFGLNYLNKKISQTKSNLNVFIYFLFSLKYFIINFKDLKNLIIKDFKICDSCLIN